MCMKRLSFITVVILSLSIFSSAKAVDFTFRLGQGGLFDDRAPEGILGGGQLVLDVKLGKLPIAISIGEEYHKKGPDAIHPYEIEGLFVVNVFYTIPLIKKWKSNVYLGGGTGVIYVPKGGEDTSINERGIMFDLAGGVNVKLFWKIGVYAEGKYIYASKTRDNIKVIDFSNHGALLGLSLNLAW